MRELLQRRRFTVAFIAFAGLAAALHASLLLRASSAVLGGPQWGAMAVWEAWWARAGFGQFDGSGLFYTTALMFPKGIPLALHAPLETAATFLLQTVAGPVAAVNFAHILFYALSGWTMYVLAHRVSRSDAGAFLGGIVFMFSHHAMALHRAGNLGESALFVLPLLLWALQGLFERPDRGGAFWLSACAIIAALATPSIAFAGVVGGAAFALFHAGRWKRLGRLRSFRYGLLAAFASVLITAFLLYWPLLVIGSDMIETASLGPTSLAAFFSPPQWHPSVQMLNLSAVPAGSGAGSGYLSMSFIVLVFAGWRRGAFRGYGAWGWLALTGLIGGLGPFLRITGESGKFPMPYILFELLPVSQSLREPSQLLGIAAAAMGVLAALAFRELARPVRAKGLRAALAGLFLLAYGWEMGLTRIAGDASVVSKSEVYQRLSSERVAGGILELPVEVGQDGALRGDFRTFLLNQVRHGWPVVLAQAPLPTWRSLAFCESTDFVYELTHPRVIASLYESADGRARLFELKRDGRKKLERHRIKYVLMHRDDPHFSEERKSEIVELLTAVLGPPQMEDKAGIILFQVY